MYTRRRGLSVNGAYEQIDYHYLIYIVQKIHSLSTQMSEDNFKEVT